MPPSIPSAKRRGVMLGREANSIQARIPATAKSSAGPSVNMVAVASSVCGKTSKTNSAPYHNCGELLYFAPMSTPAPSSNQKTPGGVIMDVENVIGVVVGRTVDQANKKNR